MAHHAIQAIGEKGKAEGTKDIWAKWQEQMVNNSQKNHQPNSIFNASAGATVQ